MKTMSRSKFESIGSAYQKALLLSMLPILAVEVLLGGALLFAIVSHHDLMQTSDRIWLVVPWILVTAIVGFFFRRNVTRLSEEFMLVCPSCKVPLGSKYLTVKRTGKCGKCGAQIIEAG